MRRMMHAAALALSLAGFAQAQKPQERLAFNLASSSANESLLIGGVESPSIQSDHFTSDSSQPELIPFGSGRPYSQLASYMNCSDASPALWNNYASERAAIAARINQHVDGTCKCFDSKCNLHSSACGPCSGGCGDSACRKFKLANLGKTNRYRSPFSTLHDAPSEACCNTCGSKQKCGCGHGAAPACCEQGGCSTGGQPQGTMSPIPGTARVLKGPRMAMPQINQGAEPDRGSQRSIATLDPMQGLQR